MQTMVRAGTLNGYSQVTKRLGFNPQPLLRQLGLDPTTLADPERRIPIASVCRFLEETARAASCPTIGIQMAEARHGLDFGVVGLVLAHKRTLREVLQAANEYRHLLNDALALFLDVEGDTVVIREEIVAEPGVPTRQATDLAVGVLARTCRTLQAPEWRPRSVHFTHTAPSDLSAYRSFFGCPLVFGSEFNGLTCAARDLDHPNPAADPELVRYAESLARPLNVSGPDAIVLDVRKAIYVLLPIDQAVVHQVAQHLHLSVRSMQRQLELAGTDFSTLLDEVRHDLAQRYMTNVRYPLGRIATLLGYTRQASFTRWFSLHFGMTPRDWRVRQIT
jgi:AraC-like DNA-binding protein